MRALVSCCLSTEQVLYLDRIFWIKFFYLISILIKETLKMKGQYKYAYDIKNVKLNTADYDKLKRTQDAAKVRLNRFITIGEIIFGLIDNDPIIRSIYESITSN